MKRQHPQPHHPHTRFLQLTHGARLWRLGRRAGELGKGEGVLTRIHLEALVERVVHGGVVVVVMWWWRGCGGVW